MLDVMSFSHRVSRLVFDAGQAYEQFRGRYETAVPPVGPRWPGDFTGRNIGWPRSAMEDREPGPHGFVLYWRADLTPRTTAVGERRPCTGYLMGSDAIPETLYRDDPAVLLYSRLRALIYIGPDDRTRFAVDQPSTVLAGFADPAIAQFGIDLDRHLAELLDTLGVGASHMLHAPVSL